MHGRDIVVIGSSAGGLQALSVVCRGLPADLPASVFVVMHTSPDNGGMLPDLLGRRASLPVAHARQGQSIRHGRIYVAPPDHHLMIERGRVRLSRGPRENRFRPAVDPLFRSAATAYGRRVIGIVLSGNMDDGTEGLTLIKHFGGVAMVQRPEDALFPGMPRSAIKHVEVDHIIDASEMAAEIDRLARAPLVGVDRARTRSGARISPGPMKAMLDLERSLDAVVVGDLDGPPSGFTCPDCGGALWERKNGDVVRFRCHVGHGFTEKGLATAQRDHVEAALWDALRSLKEKAVLQRQMAGRAAEAQLGELARAYEAEALNAEQHAATLQDLLIGEEKGASSKQRRGARNAAKRASTVNGRSKLAASSPRNASREGNGRGGAPSPNGQGRKPARRQ